MIKKLFGRSQDCDDLVSACRGEDRDKFAQLFGCAQIFCICLPPGMEKGMDPNISKEEFLKKIRADANAFPAGGVRAILLCKRLAEAIAAFHGPKFSERVRAGVRQRNETDHFISSLGRGRENRCMRTRKRRCSRPQ